MNEVLKRRIRNILTLRYDPFGPTSLPKLTWKDFIEYDGISQAVRPLLEGVIRRIVEEHEPDRIGMGISGGVDSTTVLALTRRCFPNLEIKTFCITFGSDLGESKDAQHVSELYSTDHKHITIENPFKDLEEQIEIVDEPRWNLYPYYLFKEAKSNGCDLIMTGDGGDELFGGYVFRYRSVLNSNKPVVQRYLDAHGRDWVPDQKDLFAFNFTWDEIYGLLRDHFKNPLTTLGQIFLADYNGKLLYDFTPTNIKISEHFRIKLVAPMLEPEVLHVATHIPCDLKYDARNNLGKVVLRQILLENFGYKPATKGKIGWGMGLAEMWDSYVRGMCENLFDYPMFVEQGLMNRRWLRKGFEKSDKHDLRYICKMLGLLALEIWLRKMRE